MHLAFLTSHNLLFSVCQNLLETTFWVFLSFSSRKTVQILIFEVEYLENGSADFNDFGLILHGLSDEINLFRRCSSPLSLLLGSILSFPQNLNCVILEFHLLSGVCLFLW